MKKGLLLLPFIAIFAYITFSSNIVGYTVINVSGSDGLASCAGTGTGCHGTASTTLIGVAILLDSAGMNHYVTKYTPGKSYVIKIRAINGTTNSLPKFGFQLTAVKTSGLADAGLLGVTTNTDTTRIISILTAHHTLAIPDSGSGGLGSVYAIGVPWTAPAAGTGTVKICGIVNAVNADSAASASDKWNSAIVTIQEKNLSVPVVSNAVEFKAYPNPALANLTLELNNAEAGTYSVDVFDLTGKRMVAQQVEVKGAATTTSINMQNCVPGLYSIVIGKDGVNKVISVTRQ